jgi:hypothetical protein
LDGELDQQILVCVYDGNGDGDGDGDGDDDGDDKIHCDGDGNCDANG